MILITLCTVHGKGRCEGMLCHMQLCELYEYGRATKQLSYLIPSHTSYIFCNSYASYKMCKVQVNCNIDLVDGFPITQTMIIWCSEVLLHPIFIVDAPCFMIHIHDT